MRAAEGEHSAISGEHIVGAGTAAILDFHQWCGEMGFGTSELGIVFECFLRTYGKEDCEKQKHQREQYCGSPAKG